MVANAIYLDYAAATPMRSEVIDVMRPYFDVLFANPSAVYSSGLEARKALDSFRTDVARELGVNPQTIIFTAGATESIAIAVEGVMGAHPKGHIVTTAIEHEAVLGVVKKHGHSIVPVSSEGIAEVDVVLSAIEDSTVLVSVMYANNEIGTIQHISEIAAGIEKIRKNRSKRGINVPLLLHSDASQAPAYLHVNVSRLGVDLLTLNGGKMYGPKQSGILYMHRDVVLAPYLSGGGQERGIRSGTENVAAAAGFAKALQLAQAERKVEQKRLAQLRDTMQDRLMAALNGVSVNGSLKRRLPNSLNITISGLDGERAVMELDEVGLQLATGSACSASNNAPSHVLKAIGLTDEDASASLRITLGRQTTSEEVIQATEILIKTLK